MTEIIYASISGLGKFQLFLNLADTCYCQGFFGFFFSFSYLSYWWAYFYEFDNHFNIIFYEVSISVSSLLFLLCYLSEWFVAILFIFCNHLFVNYMQCRCVFPLFGMFSALLKVFFAVLQLLNFTVVLFLRSSLMGSALCILF